VFIISVATRRDKPCNPNLCRVMLVIVNTTALLIPDPEVSHHYRNAIHNFSIGIDGTIKFHLHIVWVKVASPCFSSNRLVYLNFRWLQRISAFSILMLNQRSTRFCFQWANSLAGRIDSQLRCGSDRLPGKISP